GKFDQIASQQTLGKFDQIASQQTLGKFDQQPFSSLPLAKALTGNKPFRKRFNRKTLQCAEEKFS
ncbi:MAG: hypothetical protein JW878_01235, partial [Methanomicrobia archaeon]|nr:hypothetical protein [Methanomicrobia archaeon]